MSTKASRVVQIALPGFVELAVGMYFTHSVGMPTGRRKE